jgi:hypothetical protein
MYYPRIRNRPDDPIVARAAPDAGYSTEMGGGPELTPDRPAPAAINPSPSADRRSQRPAINTAHDALLFGGACDRCGQVYLQSQFPDGCLCPRCMLGGYKPARRARPSQGIPAQPVGGAPRLR